MIFMKYFKYVEENLKIAEDLKRIREDIKKIEDVKTGEIIKSMDKLIDEKYSGIVETSILSIALNETHLKEAKRMKANKSVKRLEEDLKTMHAAYVMALVGSMDTGSGVYFNNIRKKNDELQGHRDSGFKMDKKEVKDALHLAKKEGRMYEIGFDTYKLNIKA